MKKVYLNFLSKILWVWPLGVFLIFTLTPCSLWATLGEDLEKPKPEFTRKGDRVTAKLIPRAKSTSVLIDFEVSGAKLIDVQGMDFEKADRPEVDHKDFKSALFVIEISDLSPGAEAKFSILSDFFNSSTLFWIFNQELETPWMNSEAQNLSRSDRVQELVIKVKDGGSFDSDGVVNGQITMIGGPKDSFWGYALGTLFIRYFGIFIVLSILMIGMIISGKIFLSLDKKKTTTTRQSAPPTVAVVEDNKPLMAEKEVSPETAAAISIALDMHFSALQTAECAELCIQQLNSWTQHGRTKIMGDRFLTFNRTKR
jgi:hypothetical protein